MKMLRDIDEMIEVAPKAAEPPDHHGIARSKLGYQLVEAGPLPALAADHIFQNASASGALFSASIWRSRFCSSVETRA